MTILIKLIIFTFTASIALFGSLKAVLTITSIAICFPLFNVVPIKMPIGLTGFMLVAVLISFRFLFSTIFITQSIKIGNKQFKILLGILGLFCFYSITASISFPFIFDGAVDVYPPGNSFDNGIVKVKPSISHIAQIIYITIYFIFTLWVIQESFNKKYNYLEYHRFIFVGAIVAITFSILQLFHKTLGTPFPMEILYDMPRRSGNAIEKVILNIVPRVNGSFSEASDAARYFTSIFSASLIAITFSKKTFNRCLLLLSSLSLFLTIKTGQLITSDTFPINLAYGIIYYDFNQFEKLLKFLLLGIMPFAPLFVILFGKINKNIKISSAFIILFVCLMMIGQPILGGPDGSVNNVGRIANLCFPILTCFCFYVWNFPRSQNSPFAKGVAEGRIMPKGELLKGGMRWEKQSKERETMGKAQRANPQIKYLVLQV